MGGNTIDNKYEVVFNGDMLPGVTPEVALVNVENDMLFGRRGAEDIAFDGSNVVLYRSNSKQLAFEASKRLHKSGLKCKIRRKAFDMPMEISTSSSKMLDYAIIVFFITFAILVFNHFID